MKAFLENIAFKLIERYPKNMDEIAVVLPSKRAILFLKNYLSKEINDPIFLPKFFAIEDFIEMISGLKVLDNVSLQFYLFAPQVPHLVIAFLPSQEESHYLDTKEK